MVSKDERPEVPKQKARRGRSPTARKFVSLWNVLHVHTLTWAYRDVMLNVYVIIGVIFVPVYARCTNVHTADLLKSGEEAGCGIQHLLQRC